MLKYKITIKGVTPYMQHRMDDISLESWEKSRRAIMERPDVSKADLTRATFHAYSNTEGEFYLPAEHLRVALINAGSFMKSKVGNARKSMKNIVAAMFMVSPERIPLPPFDEVDKRSAVNRNVKARVIVIRPKWREWTATFTLLIDDDSITLETVVDLLNYAGRYVGIGSYRPTNNGFFGRFEVDNISKEQ